MFRGVATAAELAAEGMSQRQIGEVLGVGQKTVSLDLRGESNDSTARRTKRRRRPFLLPLSQMTQTRTRSRSSRRRPVTSRQAADDCFAVQVRATYERSRRSPKESSAAANAGSVFAAKQPRGRRCCLRRGRVAREGLRQSRPRQPDSPWPLVSDTGRPRVCRQLVPMAPLSGRAGALLTTRRTHAVKLRARGRLLLRRLESKGGRIPWPVRSCPSSSSGAAGVTVVGRRCSSIGVQKRRLGVDLDGGCSRNPLGERQRDQRGRSGCRRSSDPGELEQRLGLGRA